MREVDSWGVGGNNYRETWEVASGRTEEVDLRGEGEVDSGGAGKNASGGAGEVDWEGEGEVDRGYTEEVYPGCDWGNYKFGLQICVVCYVLLLFVNLNLCIALLLFLLCSNWNQLMYSTTQI